MSAITGRSEVDVRTAQQIRWDRPFPRTGCTLDAYSVYSKDCPPATCYRKRINREYHKWYSPTLGREMELLLFGHAGAPVLVFPTSMGRFFEYEDRGMIQATWGKHEAGHLQTFCIDSVDLESWYNKHAHPAHRVWRHMQYERYVIDEVLPFIRHRNWSNSLCVAGASFGGYHAVNFACRHPDLISRCVSMSGAFDIRSFVFGYYDDNIYFNNPVDYLPNMTDPWYLNHYRHN